LTGTLGRTPSYWLIIPVFNAAGLTLAAVDQQLAPKPIGLPHIRVARQRPSSDGAIACGWPRPRPRVACANALRLLSRRPAGAARQLPQAIDLDPLSAMATASDDLPRLPR